MKYVFGQRLRLARRRLGLTLQELSDRMTPSITAQAISKYESGKSLPSSDVLVGLGKALDVSLDFLMSVQVDSVDNLEFRKNLNYSKILQKDRDFAEAVVIDRLENYLSIEHILDEKINLAWLEDIRLSCVSSSYSVEELADKLRRDWKVGVGPILSLCELLESKGLKVIKDDLPESINGLSCQASRDGEIVAEVVIVSSRINVEKLRFTLAHELAHRVIQDTHNHALTKEAAMDQFARAFLVPEWSLIEDAGDTRQRISAEEVLHLKHKYRVPAETILIRLEQVGIVSEEVVRRAFKTYARKWSKIEPEPIFENGDIVATEEPRRFERLVLRAMGEWVISPVRGATLLNQSVDTVTQMYIDEKESDANYRM